MKAAFFDFTINFGGAPQGTVSLAGRLGSFSEIHIIDVYGSCAEYIRKIRQSKLLLHILYPEGKRVFIGNQGKPLNRIISIIAQLHDFWKIRKRLKKTLNEIHPDLVWVNNEKSLVFLLGPLLLSKIPIVLYYRGWGTRDQIGFFFRFLIKSRVTSVAVHSRETAAKLISYGISESKIFITPNAVNISITRAEAIKNPPDIPGLDKPLKILLPAARPILEKGHLVAVKALRRLLDKGLDPILWLPGIIPVGVNDDFLAGLKAEISHLGLEPYVHFIGWRDDIQKIIAWSDVVILPSHTEGFPRVIIEAMLLDVPVCATPVGGIPEAITEGKTGFLIDIDDDKMLADRIDLVTRDKDLRKRIIREARAMASVLFNPDKQAEAIMDYFNRIAFSNGR